MGAHEDRNTKTSVQGGASAVPTPATNVNKGSEAASKSGSTGAVEGSSDKSYQGPGHTSIPNPAAPIGGFLALTDQKGAAQAHMRQRVAQSGDGGIEETCQTEDHSFMEHKPGRPDTLMGRAVDRLTK